jgi:hypothetical protein
MWGQGMQKLFSNYYFLRSLKFVLIFFGFAVLAADMHLPSTDIKTVQSNGLTFTFSTSQPTSLVLPTMSTTTRGNFFSNTEGQFIYNLTTHLPEVWNGSAWVAAGGGVWGSITGTLSSQTDLQTALNLKAPLASPTFTGTVTAPTFAGALTGNSSTATALAANPTDCSLSQYATAIDASGNLTCAQPAFSAITGTVNLASQVTGTLPIANGGTNNASLAVTAGSMYYADGSKLIGMGAGNAGQVPVSAGSTVGWGTPVGGNFANLITNGDFSNSTTGWTASGGTFTTVNIGVNYMGVGVNNATWDSSAAGQTLTSPSYSIGNGYAGTNALYRCKVWNKSAATYTMGVWDGTTLKDTKTIDPGATAQYVNIEDSFASASGLTTAIRFTSVSSTEPLISIADCYIGVNFNLASGVVMTDWTDGGAISVGNSGAAVGTTSNNHFWYRRSGSGLDFNIQLAQTGAGNTGSGGVYQVNLPSAAGCAIDTGKVNAYTGTTPVGATNIVGFFQPNTTSNSMWGAVYVYDASHLAFLASSSSSPSSTNIVGTNTSGGSEWYSFSNASLRWNATGHVPCAGWTSTSAGVRADNSNFGWTDGGANNIGATTTAPTKGSTSRDKVWYRRNGQNLDVRIEYTQSSNGSAGSGDYLFLVPGGYSIDSNLIKFGTTVGGNSAAPPSNNIGSAGAGAASLVAGPGYVSAYDATHIRLMLKDSTSSTFQAAGNAFFDVSSAMGYAANYSVPIAGWTETQSTPMFVGTVASHTGGQEYVERALITSTCSSSPCTLASSTPGISSITRTGTGTYVVNFPSGTFSGIPSCDVVADSAINLITSTPTATTFPLSAFNAGATPVNWGIASIKCQGPR